MEETQSCDAGAKQHSARSALAPQERGRISLLGALVSLQSAWNYSLAPILYSFHYLHHISSQKQARDQLLPTFSELRSSGHQLQRIRFTTNRLRPSCHTPYP